jgi:hypothetical protein
MGAQKWLLWEQQGSVALKEKRAVLFYAEFQWVINQQRVGAIIIKQSCHLSFDLLFYQ